MLITEQKRQVMPPEKIETMYTVGQLSVRLISTFGEDATMDKMLYSIACQRMMDKMDKKATSLC